MTDAQDHSGLPEDELTAAEYALGVLSGPERAAAAARAQREPGFARLIVAWEEQLTPWAVEIEERLPPPYVWNAIAAELPIQTPARASLWQNLVFWRGAALVGALAAACLAVFIYLAPQIHPGPQSTPLVATIDGGGQHHFVATVDRARGSIAVVPAAFSPDPTRVPELWLIPADGKPRPLGLLDGARTITLSVPPNLAALVGSNAVLAVSLEPPGGSPTDAPTGPVIGAGKLTAL